MAIALPVYVTDASAVTGLKLPAFVTDASAVTGLKLPAFVTDASAVTGLKLPAFVTNASAVTGLKVPAFQVELPLNFTHVPTGGSLVGGNAVIAGDPLLVIPTGGALIGGAAPNFATNVLIFTLYPLGGTLIGGTGPDAFAWTTFKPTSGAVVGGAAPNSSGSIIFPTSGGVKIGGAALDVKFVPTGGALIGGVALDSFLKPTGGTLIGGAAVVSIPLIFTQTPTGGTLIGGVAPLVHVQPVIPTGGTVVGGVAVVKDAYPVYIPSGGAKVSGVAVAFFLPSGIVSTPENPYNDEFSGWVLNYETGAPARYAGLPANSLCRFNGKTYVANAGGIYELTGTTDAGQPIHASILIPKTDFDDGHNKRIPAVYLGVRSTGTLLLKVLVKGQSDRYYAITAGASYIRGSRVTLGRGLEARYWQFRLENMAGADFELGDMEVKPTILKRHGV